ncbi:DUF998 domain-containing protein [Burkholderiaceae bacterium DAT-1]|nr:DUF998 domain-containing protein [Burkholderiaceae bacterium DAT-1]
MNRVRAIGLANMAVPVWFVGVYAWVAMQRPDFRHFNQAVSELGAWGAPNMWVWNALGYLLPGLLILSLGLALRRQFQVRGRTAIPFTALVLSGAFMAISGVFPGDFENRTSPSMILHSVGSFGSGLCFMVAAFWLPGRFRQVDSWKGIYWPLLGIAIAMVLNTFLVTPGPTPGLGQRISFACYFFWVALVGWAMYRHPILDGYSD